MTQVLADEVLFAAKLLAQADLPVFKRQIFRRPHPRQHALLGFQLWLALLGGAGC